MGGLALFAALGVAASGCKPEPSAPDNPLPDAAPSVCAPALAGRPASDAFRRQRTATDQPDDEPDAYQVHVLYVEPADREATPRLDEDGTIRHSVAAWNAWVAHKTDGAAIRLDTCDGILDVTHVKLPLPYTERALAAGAIGTPGGVRFLRDRLEAILGETFDAPNKLYLVFYDGLMFGACGGAPYPPALPGRFTLLYVGGIFRATYLEAAAAAGATTLQISTAPELPLPAPPFTASLEGEAITIIAIDAGVATLQSPLAAAKPLHGVLAATTDIPPCRSNEFSHDGNRLGYWEFSGIHEVLHALGIVSAAAVDAAPPPVAPGHLADTSSAGKRDVMFQGNAPWDCQEFPPAANAAASTCALDEDRRNYYLVDDPEAVDLAESVFLTPSAAGAKTPPLW